jgi:transporter family-2 protein
MSQALACFLAALGGVALSVQIALNVHLRQGLGHALLAGCVSFIVGALTLGVAAGVLRVPLPAPAAVAQIPWWAWLGGILGAYYVSTTIVLGPRLGAGLFVVLVVAGQLVSALVIDQLGLLGPAVPPAPGRLAGAALALAGVWLMQRG